MRMTKLKLEDLVVESFTTGPAANAGGTVRGQQDPFTGAVADGVAPFAESDQITCRWTCDDLTCGTVCPDTRICCTVPPTEP